MVTTDTRRVVAVIISFSGKEGLEHSAQRLSDLFQHHASGNSLEQKIIA